MSKIYLNSLIIFILGITHVYAFPFSEKNTNEDKVKLALIDIRSIEASLLLFQVDNFMYPSSNEGLHALVKNPNADKYKYWTQYLKKIPIDPWGKKYKYLNPGLHGEFDIYSLGPDGNQSNDDVGNWMLYEKPTPTGGSLPKALDMNYKKLIESQPSESALESLNRYEKLIQILVDTLDGFENNLSPYYVIDYLEKDKITRSKSIELTEERFDITLPESYKAFMIEKGPFSFGEDNRDNYLFAPRLRSLVDEILDTEYYADKEGIVKDYGKDGLKRMEQLICFEKRDDYEFVCFDMTSYSLKTKEMDIYLNGQDGWLGYKVNQTSFDDYIVTQVNQEIEQVLDNNELAD